MTIIPAACIYRPLEICKPFILSLFSFLFDIMLFNKLLTTFILFYIVGFTWADDSNDELMPPEIARQIQDCANACQIYRNKLFDFLTEMNTTTWEITQKEFATCQDMCPRCSLRDAVICMKSIDKFSPTFPPEKAQFIKWQQTDIIPAVTGCVDQWNRSAIFGCDRNPVEGYTSDCILG